MTVSAPVRPARVVPMPRDAGHGRRIYTLAPIVDRFGDDNSLLALLLDVARRQVIRWREYGITADQADVLAVRLGVPACALWPTWFDDGLRL